LYSPPLAAGNFIFLVRQGPLSEVLLLFKATDKVGGSLPKYFAECPAVNRGAFCFYKKYISLPPYSPELNPVEHIWDNLRKKEFHNRLFDSIDFSEDHLGKSITRYGV
jgi:hypothetical protein